jgi:hypothetical protein
MEIALEMARHRAGRGAATAGDRSALDRADLLADDWPAFAALPASGAPTPGFDLDCLVAGLARERVRVAAVDLPGAPGGLSVAKVFATGLAPFPAGRRAAEGTPGSRARLMG